jgi:hypothetical protein
VRHPSNTRAAQQDADSLDPPKHGLVSRKTVVSTHPAPELTAQSASAASATQRFCSDTDELSTRSALDWHTDVVPGPCSGRGMISGLEGDSQQLRARSEIDGGPGMGSRRARSISLRLRTIRERV